jgi:LCP family protein required for cell wall assembly
LQIPRDTYFNCSDGNYKKINGAYNSLGSAKAFSEELERALGIKIDYYLSFNLDTVAQIVDTVKGIKVNVPFDMDYEDPAQNLSIHLKKGEQELDGKEAIQFLRYRSGYVTGDLGRIDAQKIFIDGFYHSVKNADALKIFKLFCTASDNLVTDVNIGTLIPLLLKGKGEDNEEITYVTLPGEAVMIDGISYYFLNRNSVSQVLSKHVKSYNGVFDKDHVYLNKRDEYSKIYEKENLKYEEYNLENIDSLEIKKK